MSKAIITAERLVQLSQFHPRLQNVWYLLASSALSALNQPQEIPKLYHYTLMLHYNSTLPVKHRATPIELANRTIDLLSNIDPHSSHHRPLPQQHKLIDRLYPSSLKGTPTMDTYRQITIRFRECLLKICPLVGLPRGINSLHHLHSTTPTSILNSIPTKDTDTETTTIDMYNDSTDACPESSTLRTQTRTTETVSEVYTRGKRYWNKVYDKVSNRVANDLYASYPDLWYYALRHVYGPILSFSEVLGGYDTSLVIISALVPLEVPAQLRGHLRGALNVGCDEEVVGCVREMATLVAQWCREEINK